MNVAYVYLSNSSVRSSQGDSSKALLVASVIASLCNSLADYVLFSGLLSWLLSSKERSPLFDACRRSCQALWGPAQFQQAGGIVYMYEMTCQEGEDGHRGQ